MDDSRLHEAMTRIQELLVGETGTPLHGRAVDQLEHILRSFGGHPQVGAQGFEEREVTVLLADLRGFTALTAHLGAGSVLEVLNRHLTRMSEIVVQHGGTIDKFIGDAIMVLFGAPLPQPDAAIRAVTCAVEMQRAVDEINGQRRLVGEPEVYMGIGIETGRVMAGLLGSELFFEYTVIGEAVNLAARIESLSLRGQVLIGEATLACCATRLRTGPPVEVMVKGGAQPLRVHEVLEILSPALAVPRREARHSPRVRVGVAARYRRVEGQQVAAEEYPATVVDIGYAGLLLELRSPLPLRADLVLAFELAGPVSARDVYAKVRRIQHLHGRTFAGVEFTSLDGQLERDIRREVQRLLQLRHLPVAPLIHVNAVSLATP